MRKKKKGFSVFICLLRKLFVRLEESFSAQRYYNMLYCSKLIFFQSFHGDPSQLLKLYGNIQIGLRRENARICMCHNLTHSTLLRQKVSHCNRKHSNKQVLLQSFSQESNFVESFLFFARSVMGNNYSENNNR